MSLGEPEMPAHCLKTWNQLSIPVKVGNAAAFGIWEHKVDTHQHAREAHLGEISRAAQLQENDFVHF